MRPPWFPSSPAGSGAIPCSLVRDGLLRRDAAHSCLHSAGRVSAMLMPVAVCAELLGQNVSNGRHLVLYCCMDHDFHDLFVPLCRLACLAALQSARSIQAAREGADAFDYPEHGAERMSFLFLLSVSARTLAYMPLRALVRGPHTWTLPQAVCVCVRVYGYICVCSLIAVAYLSFPLARTFSRSSLLDRSLLSATIAPPQFTVCAGQVGANFWIFWISILIPVLYVAIGAVVGFVMGITYGSILSGIMLQAAINVDEMMLFETQVLIGFAIACLLQLFAFAPPSVAVLFM